MEFEEDLDFFYADEDSYDEDSYDEESTTEEEPDLTAEYQQFWQEKYSPDYPGLQPMAQIRRERLLKKPGEWERMREVELPKIQERVRERVTGKRVKTVTQKFKEIGLCNNLTSEERQTIPNSLLVTLQVKPKGSDRPIKVCYNILNLYPYLVGKYGTNPILWRDPHTKELFSEPQRNRIQRLFSEKILCNRPQISGNYKVDAKNGSQGKIVIPNSLYQQILQRGLITGEYPLIFQLINIIPGTGGKKVEDSQIVFAGLDDMIYHDKETISIPKELMRELKTKSGDYIYVQDCLGLPIAKSVILYPQNQVLWSKIPETAIDTVLEQLQDLINANYYTLQVSQVLPIVIDGIIYDLQVAQITDLENNDVLSALVTIPGGMELQLGFTDTLNIK